jgi:hypothetical protein
MPSSFAVAAPFVETNPRRGVEGRSPRRGSDGVPGPVDQKEADKLS